MYGRIYDCQNTEYAAGRDRSVVRDVVGRDDEMICYRDAQVPPLEIDRLFAGLDNILQYQVNFDHDRFTVKIVPEDKRAAVDLTAITERFMKRFKDPDIKITFDLEDRILPKRRGKYASVVIG